VGGLVSPPPPGFLSSRRPVTRDMSMGNVAKRLRRLHADWSLAGKGPDIFIEAADEIDRLTRQLAEAQAALKSITEIEDEQYGSDWCEIEKAREIAAAALSQSAAMGTQ
jgi:hypothetical protein